MAMKQSRVTAAANATIGLILMTVAGCGFPSAPTGNQPEGAHISAKLAGPHQMFLLNTPPVARCQSRTVAGNAQCQGCASINDGSFDPDPGDTVTCQQSPGCPYGPGSTVVTLTCTDDHGASASCSATVTVTDSVPPQITCPGDQTLMCENGGAIASYPPATATDNCGKATVACAPPEGTPLPPGETPVTCVATDGAGNTATCTFKIDVANQAPVARCKPPQTVSANGQCMGTASVNDGSSDPDGGAVVCTQTPGPWPLGTTQVTLTCVDGCGGTSSCTTTVTVVDDTPPTIACPQAQTDECSDHGANACFPPPVATDNCPGVTSTCSPLACSRFAFGATQDQCTATDASGNRASCSFQVNVVDTVPPVVTPKGDQAGVIASLWPPNHGYTNVTLEDCISSVTDQCADVLSVSGSAKILRVTSDELEDDQGSGHTCNDIVVDDPVKLSLRSEREGGGVGRLYTIYYEVSDPSGNTALGVCKVDVRHDQGKMGGPTPDACEAGAPGPDCDPVPPRRGAYCVPGKGQPPAVCKGYGALHDPNCNY